ncbi:MAG: T9SS type A sorting domain-containing protein [Candidatus Neomarinimicrobiota bacterium]
MKGRSLLIALLLLMGLVAVPVSGQSDWTQVTNKWEFVENLGDTLSWPNWPAVDKNDRIWIADWGRLLVRNHDGSNVAVYDSVYLPGGAVAGGDTLVRLDQPRGICALNNGNILYARNPGHFIFELDADAVVQTDDTVHITALNLHVAEPSPTKPTQDAGGYIYYGCVSGVSPIYMIDPADFANVAQVIELPDPPGLTRGIAVSADGSMIIVGDLSSSPGPLLIYTSTDFVNYTLTDSVFKDAAGDTIFPTQRITMEWGPDSTLWVSSNDYGLVDTTVTKMVVLDFKKKEYMNIWSEWPGRGPRGVAFSHDGQYAYIDDDDASLVRIYRDTTWTVDVADAPEGIPVGYGLYQNYPNPFNPTTQIVYEIPETELVTLEVYNLLGHKVRTLVDGIQTVGAHIVVWDARADNGMPVASGTYFYRLKVSTGSITKTMIFIK